MLQLGPNQTCPHSHKCPHVGRGLGNCMGTDPNRSNVFTCEFVDNQGNISESGFRNPKDQTGTQKVLHS